MMLDRNLDNDKSRLRWRCRRGMLELDILLNNFLVNHYDNLSNDEKNIFDSMLDYPDQVLLDLLMDIMMPVSHDIGRIAKLVRLSIE